MTAETITDADGDRWPVTGFWCSECGMPLHPAIAELGVHPGCEATS